MAWAKELKQGNTVHVRIELNYADDTLRASSYNVHTVVHNPTTKELVRSDERIIINPKPAAN
jgi:hypothetical protein